MKVLSSVLLAGFFSFSAQAHTFVPACINVYMPTEGGKFGEHFFPDSKKKNAGNPDLSQLRIFSQNFENLGEFKENSRTKQLIDGEYKEIITEKILVKSQAQNMKMAARIKKHNPDIILGMEVKDIKAAQEFSEKFLDDKYQAILIEGNDSRGIDVCFFVKRTLNFDLEVESHKKYSLTNQIDDPVFSRDLPMLLVRPAGAAKNSKPIMALFATHLKSRRGSADDNDKTAIKRTEQVQASMEIINELTKKYPGTPVVMGGDYNNHIQTAPEFNKIYKTGFSDALDFDTNPVNKDQRFTQYFFKFKKETPDPNDSVLIASQLDAMFVNREFGRFILASGIQRDIKVDGTETKMPQTPDDVNKRASDHDGLFLVLDFKALLKSLFP